MKYSVRVNKYYESRKIHEELGEDNPAVYLLFGLCNYIAGNNTVKQGRQILEDLKRGKLHEIPDYNVNDVTNVENYKRTGKMKYDMKELAKDNETIGELLHRSFKDIWDKTTEDLNGVINGNTLALIEQIKNIDTALQEADPTIFETSFHKLMNQYDWTETKQKYRAERQKRKVTMWWLQEKQEQELQKVLLMDIMHHADEPSTQHVEDVDYDFHKKHLPHNFIGDLDYQVAYTKFMTQFATRKEELIIPQLDEYGKHIALNFSKFRPEQQKALFAIIKRFELIHEDMVKRKPELAQYLRFNQENTVSLENTNLFAPYFYIKEMLKGKWFKDNRADTKYNDKWAEGFAGALMRSEYGCQIAEDWKEKDYKIKGYVIGCLKKAGVFKSNLSNNRLAKDAAIISKTRTFAKYIGSYSREQPYFEWIKKHVNDYCQ